jgi:hypothetical protein
MWDDRYQKETNHTALVEKLEQMGIKKCHSEDGEKTYYYCHNGQEYGVVDDYCFASIEIAESSVLFVSGSDEWTLEGGIKRWRGLSDHCPIIVCILTEEDKREWEKFVSSLPSTKEELKASLDEMFKEMGVLEALQNGIIHIRHIREVI